MCGGLARYVRGVNRIKKGLTPSPSPAERGVLETVCLSNQVMMNGNICEPQGVSRISLPSLWGRGEGEGLFVVVCLVVLLLLFTTAPSAFLTTPLILLHSPLLYI